MKSGRDSGPHQRIEDYSLAPIEQYPVSRYAGARLERAQLFPAHGLSALNRLAITMRDADDILLFVESLLSVPKVAAGHPFLRMEPWQQGLLLLQFLHNLSRRVRARSSGQPRSRMCP